MTLLNPVPGKVADYCRSIPYNGYGRIEAIHLANGVYQLVYGHHRVQALRNLGRVFIKIFISKSKGFIMIFYDTEIVAIDSTGISLKRKKEVYFIDFIKCNHEFQKQHPISQYGIGSRDITKHMFIFCDNSQSETTIFVRKKHILDFSQNRRFRVLQRTINSFGYTTLDLS